MAKSKLYIKGMQEPLEISFDAYMLAKKFFLDEKIPKDFKMNIGDWSGEKGQIKSILSGHEIEKKTYTKNYNDEYEKGRKERLAMKPKQRAENSKGYFDYIFYGFTREAVVPDEAWQEAKELMTEFYKKNPERLWADPMIFASMFPSTAISDKVFQVLKVVTEYDENQVGVIAVSEEESLEASMK